MIKNDEGAAASHAAVGSTSKEDVVGSLQRVRSNNHSSAEKEKTGEYKRGRKQNQEFKL